MNQNYLARIEVRPLTIVERVVEVGRGPAAGEVYEGVTQVAPVLEVDGQVEEVVLCARVLVQHLQEHLLIVLVGDVAHHDRRARPLGRVPLARRLAVEAVQAVEGSVRLAAGCPSARRLGPAHTPAFTAGGRGQRSAEAAAGEGARERRGGRRSGRWQC